VRAALQDLGSGWCAGLLAALAGIAGIFAGIPGAALAGGSAAAFFGTIPGAVC
jgi:hypothetical protein